MARRRITAGSIRGALPLSQPATTDSPGCSGYSGYSECSATGPATGITRPYSTDGRPPSAAKGPRPAVRLPRASHVRNRSFRFHPRNRAAGDRRNGLPQAAQMCSLARPNSLVYRYVLLLPRQRTSPPKLLHGPGSGAWIRDGAHRPGSPIGPIIEAARYLIRILAPCQTFSGHDLWDERGWKAEGGRHGGKVAEGSVTSASVLNRSFPHPVIPAEAGIQGDAP